MDTINLDKLLLKTAFSCMACDGDIDKREVKLIKQLHQENRTFGVVDINEELDKLLASINENGQEFLRGYFKELIAYDLTEADELKIIEIAIATIKADDKIEYSEVKFFKVIRSKLNIKNEPILAKHPDFEDYLEQDIISESYLSGLLDDYFGGQNLPKFELSHAIDLNDITNQDSE